jgi:hypothetical protein
MLNSYQRICVPFSSTNRLSKGCTLMSLEPMVEHYSIQQGNNNNHRRWQWQQQQPSTLLAMATTTTIIDATSTIVNATNIDNTSSTIVDATNIDDTLTQHDHRRNINYR